MGLNGLNAEGALLSDGKRDEGNSNDEGKGEHDGRKKEKMETAVDQSHVKFTACPWRSSENKIHGQRPLIITCCCIFYNSPESCGI